MDSIVIYADEELKNPIGGTFIREYASVIDTQGISDHHFGYNIPIGEETYTIRGLIEYTQSTVKNSEAEPIMLPVTTSNSGYVYLSRQLRLKYKCAEVSANRYSWTFNTFEYNNGNGWSAMFPEFSHTTVDAYAPIEIYFSKADLTRDDVQPYFKGKVLGVDVRYKPWDSPQSYANSRFFIGMDHREEALDINEQYNRPTEAVVRGGNGYGFFVGDDVSPMGGNQLNTIFRRFLSSNGNGLTYYIVPDAWFPSFMSYLYQEGLLVDREAVRDACISCIYLPITPVSKHASNNNVIYLTYKGFNAQSWNLQGTLYIVDDPIYIGQTDEYSIEFQGMNTFADITENEYQVYLPFYGNVNIDPAAIFQGKLYVRYSIDCRNGNIVYNIVTKSKNDKKWYVYGSYSGNCGVSVPLVGSGQSGTTLGKVENVTDTAARGALAGYKSIMNGAIPSIDFATSVAGTSALGALGTLFNQITPVIDKSGTVSPVTSQMDVLDIRLNIARKIMIVSDKYDELVGYPAAKTVKLKDVTGFIKVDYCKLDNVPIATEQEKDEILFLLKGGVFL